MNWIAFVFVLAFLGGLAIGAWLVIRGHPWFALLVFLMITSLEVRANGKNSEFKL